MAGRAHGRAARRGLRGPAIGLPASGRATDRQWVEQGAERQRVWRGGGEQEQSQLAASVLRDKGLFQVAARGKPFLELDARARRGVLRSFWTFLALPADTRDPTAPSLQRRSDTSTYHIAVLTPFQTNLRRAPTGTYNVRGHAGLAPDIACGHTAYLPPLFAILVASQHTRHISVSVPQHYVIIMVMVHYDNID